MPIRKVLVVDDSPTDLANIKGILGEAGCVIVTATNGKEAIEKASAEKPDLIFMDIIMPDMDGYAACRSLGNQAETKSIPVIFVTAFPERLLTGKRPEPAFLITKPYVEDQVRSAVSQAMFFASTETLAA